MKDYESELTPEQKLESELFEILKISHSQESQAIQKALSIILGRASLREIRQSKTDFATNMYHLFNSQKEPDKSAADAVHKYLLNKAVQNDYLCKQLFNAIDSSVESLKAASNSVLLEDLRIKGREIIGEPEFRDKQESQGKQFGIKVNYKYRDQYNQNGNITYYVKAHDKYHISSSRQPTGQGPSVPDLKELLVYKILEHSGFGSKSHFIFNPFSRAGLFIATQDAGFTKLSPEAKYKSFNIAGKENEKPDFITKVEQESQHVGISDEKIKVTTLDILARILRLTDLNMDNYGYVNTKELQDVSLPEKNKLRIIDFKVREEENYDISNRIYSDFKSGNSELAYTGFAGKLLKNRDEVEKIQLGNAVLENMQMPRGNKKTIEAAIISAVEDVKNYIDADLQRKEKLGIAQEHILDLEKYASELTKNYNSLKRDLLQNKILLNQQGQG